MIPLYDDNPRTTFPIVTLALIAVNVLAYLWQQALGPNQYLYTMIPSLVTGSGPGLVQIDNARYALQQQAIAPWMTVFSAMFMHGSLMHIGGNMLYLWIFGDNIEEDLGPVKYLVFYLVVGVVAAVAHIMGDPASRIPTLGASGAVAGVMGGYILLHPRAEVNCLLPIGFFSTLIRVPAYIVLGIWFVYQVVLNQVGKLGGSQGGVAYLAHIGGFVAGLILIKVFGPKRRPEAPQYYFDAPGGPWR